MIRVSLYLLKFPPGSFISSSFKRGKGRGFLLVASSLLPLSEGIYVFFMKEIDGLLCADGLRSQNFESSNFTVCSMCVINTNIASVPFSSPSIRLYTHIVHATRLSPRLSTKRNFVINFKA